MQDPSINASLASGSLCPSTAAGITNKRGDIMP